MVEYEQMYKILFNSIVDALREMEVCNYGNAIEILKAAQLKTEDIFIEKA